ncbi:MAG: hypothetical protein ACK4F8_11675 [Aquabacterium sp.]
MPVFQCQQQADIFIDALACDRRSSLIFVSLYGRDGSIQQFLSRIQLGSSADGISSISVSDPSGARLDVSVGDPRRLEKVSGQIPKGSLFGKLGHLWVYDPTLLKPDKANLRGWLLFDQDHGAAEQSEAIWELIKALSPVPLLDHWQEAIEGLVNAGSTESGIHAAKAIGDLKPVEVQLPSDFESQVSQLIIAGQLALEPCQTQSSLIDQAAA